MGRECHGLCIGWPCRGVWWPCTGLDMHWSCQAMASTVDGQIAARLDHALVSPAHGQPNPTHGTAIGLPGHVLGSTGHQLVCVWSVLAMGKGWAGHSLGWSGHGLRVPWAMPGMS
jgi:hypothetical protein